MKSAFRPEDYDRILVPHIEKFINDLGSASRFSFTVQLPSPRKWQPQIGSEMEMGNLPIIKWKYLTNDGQLKSSNKIYGVDMMAT